MTQTVTGEPRPRCPVLIATMSLATTSAYGAVVVLPERQIQLKEGFTFREHQTRLTIRAIAAAAAAAPGVDLDFDIWKRWLTGPINAGWLTKWHAAGWRKGNGERVEDHDVWELLIPHLGGRTIRCKTTEAHRSAVLELPAGILLNRGLQEASSRQIEELRVRPLADMLAEGRVYNDDAPLW